MHTISLNVECSVDKPDDWKVGESTDAWLALSGPRSEDGFLSNVVVMFDRVPAGMELNDVVLSVTQQLETTYAGFEEIERSNSDNVVDRTVHFKASGVSIVQYQRYVLFTSGVSESVNWLVQVQASCSTENHVQDAPILLNIVSSLVVGARTLTSDEKLG